MKIKTLPNVLALHLKRFKYQEDSQRYSKLSYRVAFPFELRLFNTVDDAPNPDRLYQLFAIVVHIGGWVYDYIFFCVDLQTHLFLGARIMVTISLLSKLMEHGSRLMTIP